LKTIRIYNKVRKQRRQCSTFDHKIVNTHKKIKLISKEQQQQQQQQRLHQTMQSSFTIFLVMFFIATAMAQNNTIRVPRTLFVNNMYIVLSWKES
jgi:uncharacterized membrane protein